MVLTILDQAYTPRVRDLLIEDNEVDDTFFTIKPKKSFVTKIRRTLARRSPDKIEEQKLWTLEKYPKLAELVDVPGAFAKNAFLEFRKEFDRASQDLAAGNLGAHPVNYYLLEQRREHMQLRDRVKAARLSLRAKQYVASNGSLPMNVSELAELDEDLITSSYDGTKFEFLNLEHGWIIMSKEAMDTNSEDENRGYFEVLSVPELRGIHQESQEE